MAVSPLAGNSIAYEIAMTLFLCAETISRNLPPADQGFEMLSRDSDGTDDALVIQPDVTPAYYAINILVNDAPFVSNGPIHK